MAKRYTDSNKWQDEWFLSLDNDSRIVWQYILDNCTHAGRIKKNFKMLNFCCYTNYDDESFKGLFKGRVIDRGNYYFIPKFLKFQYARGLNSNKPAIVSVRNELIEYGLIEIVRESLGNDYITIKDTDKDNDKDKDKGGAGGKTKLWPIKGKSCGSKGCSLPAIHQTNGEFTHYYCGEHMPESVKEKYCA